MDAAVALGIDDFDTAERYALGGSEQLIGEWLRMRPASVGGRVRIATKVAPRDSDAEADTPFDRRYIQSKLAVSLERLGVGSVAFYLSHAPDERTTIEETLEGFVAVREAGLAQHIGCCNVSAQELRGALDAAQRLGVVGFEWVQNGYSLLSPDEDAEVRALCQERGLGYTPFSPLAGGVLSGRYRRGEPFPEGSRLALRPEGYDEMLTDRVHDALDRLRETAAAHGVSAAALALRWIISHPECSAPVVGPARGSDPLGHVAQALDLQVDPTTWQALRDCFAAAGSS
jgi:aryl-alcohol dehydrogenase-like predicted oxidoreductase